MAEALLINNRHIDVDHLNHRLIKARRELARAKLKYMAMAPGEAKIDMGHAIARVQLEMKRLEAIRDQAPRITYYNGQVIPANAQPGNGPC